MTGDQQKAMANRIKARRESLGYTQEQFAEVAELSASSYTKIENAFQRPRLDTLIRISEKLGVSLDYLVFGEVKPKEMASDEMLSSILELSDKEKLAHARDVLNRLIRMKDE